MADQTFSAQEKDVLTIYRSLRTTYKALHGVDLPEVLRLDKDCLGLIRQARAEAGAKLATFAEGVAAQGGAAEGIDTYTNPLRPFAMSRKKAQQMAGLRGQALRDSVLGFMNTLSHIDPDAVPDEIATLLGSAGVVAITFAMFAAVKHYRKAGLVWKAAAAAAIKSVGRATIVIAVADIVLELLLWFADPDNVERSLLVLVVNDHPQRLSSPGWRQQESLHVEHGWVPAFPIDHDDQGKEFQLLPADDEAVGAAFVFVKRRFGYRGAEGFVNFLGEDGRLVGRLTYAVPYTNRAGVQVSRDTPAIPASDLFRRCYDRRAIYSEFSDASTFLYARITADEPGNLSGLCVFARTASTLVGLAHQEAQSTGRLVLSGPEPAVIPGIGLTESPSFVSFAGRLYVFYQEAGNSGRLFYSVHDGKDWGTPGQVPNTGVSHSPSAVVCNDQIVVVHHGGGEDGSLWFNVFDGQQWRGDQKIAQECITQSPWCVSVIGRDGPQVYCFHQGAAHSGDLVVRKFDGNGWTLVSERVPDTKVSATPAAALHGDKIILVHQGGWDNGQMWCKAYDPARNEWSLNHRVDNAFISESPACEVTGNILRVAYRQGGGSDKIMLQQAEIDIYKNQIRWSAPAPVTNAQSWQRPALLRADFPSLSPSGNAG
jgi:hypothetical protein